MTRMTRTRMTLITRLVIDIPELMQGRVIRAAGGFYDVKTREGKDYRCNIRGKHKNRENFILAGDIVKFTPGDSDSGIIEKILPRENRLTRPSVANISQIITVVSAKKPFPDWNLLSRQLVSAESRGIRPVICMNKADLIDESEKEELGYILNLFPYPHLLTSALTGQGTDSLREVLNNNVSVFTGSSGVGKSSLINVINPGINLRTAEISHKGERGRHTTRHVEIFSLDEGGMVVDTPGFTRIDISSGDFDAIDGFFPEMEEYRLRCRFRNCFHRDEPGCAVKEAVKKELISDMRYKHYLLFLKELAE